MRKKIIIATIAVLGICAGILFFYNPFIAQTEPFQLYTVKKSSIEESIYLTGKIDARERVKLSFPSGGRLTWLPVKEGQQIIKGQAVAAIDAEELAKKLKQDLLTYENTRIDFENISENNKNYKTEPDKKIATEMKRAIDKAQNNLNNSVLDVEIRSLAQRNSLLVTPISGVVTRVPKLFPGQHTGVGDEIEVANPNTEYFTAVADAKTVLKLQVGMTAEIRYDDLVDTVLPGKVDFVSYAPKSGESGSVYEVRIGYSKPKDINFKLGMIGEAKFTLLQKNSVLAIPPSYISLVEGKKIVSVNKQNEIITQEITTGLETSSLVEVTSGLQEGDLLVPAVF